MLTALIKKYKYNICLILVAAFWGCTYGITKICLNYTSEFTLLTIRFGLAFVIAFPFLYKKITPITKYEIISAAKLSTMMFAACLSLTYGVKHTKAANAGFIVGLFIVFVPLILRVFFKEKLQMHTIASLAVSMIGISMLTLSGDLTMHPGDLLCLICAAAYAAHVVYIGRFVRGSNPAAIGVLQFLFMAFYAGILQCILHGGISMPSSPIFWFGALFMSVFCTAFCFVAQAVAQQNLSATASGIILSLEPVFAAAAAFLLLGETLGPRQIAGAALMMGSVVWTSIRESRV